MKGNRSKDIEKIKETLQYYTDAFKENNYKKIINSFHPEARVVWVNYEDNTIFIKPCASWKNEFESIKGKNRDIKFKTVVEKIDCTGTAAIARLKWIIETPEETRFTTDYLTLLKFDTNWLIVNKSGHYDFKPKEGHENRRSLDKDNSCHKT
ncbi:MAG: nuclear transport factor 2 family protein [Candidatus Hermodarchaeota archaeon]